MKQNTYIIIIIILLVGVATTQYFIYFKNPEIINKGKVKSATTDKNDFNLPEINIKNINLAPTQKGNYTKPNILAKNYILVDSNSLYVLAEKDSNIQVPIASTTKIMTAIIVLENYKLSDVITMSQNAATQIGSDVYLRTNEKITVENLLYALLVNSGNDAAMALAENIGLNNFINKMNEKAAYLGMNDTKYKDPAGLDDSGHSTAKDLAIITAYAINNETFKKIISTADITITSVDGKTSHKLENSNRLIKVDEPLFYNDSIGGKTGFTPDAGHCLVAAAKKDNHIIISVILNTLASTNDASARESKKLLEWGFDNYNW